MSITIVAPPGADYNRDDDEEPVARGPIYEFHADGGAVRIDTPRRDTPRHAHSLDDYVRHAERFGVELVFETAAGFGGFAPFDGVPDLTIDELVTLGRRLRELDAKFNPAKPDRIVKLAGSGRSHARNITPALERLATPEPTMAARTCEWCGVAIAGRSDRRTHSAKCKKALQRAGGIGPFTRPEAGHSAGSDRSIAGTRSVPFTPDEHGDRGGENRGVSEFPELSPEVLR